MLLFENHSVGQQYLLDRWLNTIRSLRNIRHDSTSLVKWSVQASSLDLRCMRGKIWKGDVLVANVDGRFRDSSSETQTQRRVLMPRSGEQLLFPCALAGRDQVFRTSTLIQDPPAQGEEHNGVLQGEHKRMTSKTDHLYRHHREFGGQTLRAERRAVPNTTPIGACCQTDKHDIGCVAGKSHRRLMVAGRHRGRGLVSLRSQYRAGSLQNVTRCPGRDSQRFKQHPGPITYGQKDGQVCRKSAQQKEKQRWTGEKSKLDNARGLRGIWYMDPDDMEVQDIMKNELKSPLESAMLRKTVTKQGKTCCAKFQ